LRWSRTLELVYRANGKKIIFEEEKKYSASYLGEERSEEEKFFIGSCK
jgi:hypothetical protein